jgi:hypothetical protein
MDRIFLLSPARTDGRRAAMLTNPAAGFALAQALQRGEPQPLGRIFAFLSGLYFRGKLAYATAFGRAPAHQFSGYVITSHRGLLPLAAPTTLADLRAFGAESIDLANPRYVEPLRRSVRALAAPGAAEFVLLGSISTDRYVQPLLEVLDERLLFPTAFLGRGDMSRGSLLLRAARDDAELAYQPLVGAVRRGPRPPRLAPASWRGTPWDAGVKP